MPRLVPSLWFCQIAFPHPNPLPHLTLVPSMFPSLSSLVPSALWPAQLTPSPLACAQPPSAHAYSVCGLGGGGGDIPRHVTLAGTQRQFDRQMGWDLTCLCAFCVHCGSETFICEHSPTHQVCCSILKFPYCVALLLCASLRYNPQPTPAALNPTPPLGCACILTHMAFCHCFSALRWLCCPQPLFPYTAYTHLCLCLFPAFSQRPDVVGRITTHLFIPITCPLLPYLLPMNWTVPFLGPCVPFQLVLCLGSSVPKFCSHATLRFCYYNLTFSSCSGFMGSSVPVWYFGVVTDNTSNLHI